MRRIYAYTFSLLLIIVSSLVRLNAQDTVSIPLKIRVGLDVSGPIIYFTEKKVLSTEGYVSVDLNESTSVVLGAGYLDYKYSQRDPVGLLLYEYMNKGVFFRAGADFNLLKPQKSQGKYFVGVGLRYGISFFNSEVPIIQQENYWGINSFSIDKKVNWGHFVELSPGVRAELFKNFAIGWTFSLRRLLYTNTGKDLPPIYFPGYGNGSNKFSIGLSYFFVWNIPFKKINVIIKKEEPEEPEIPAGGANGQ